jgi:hypothetical protein
VPSFPIDTFLIDDGWQDVTTRPAEPSGHRPRALRSFGAWDGLGGSIKEVVDAIKAKGVKYVGAWMTLQGYWDGIDPDGELNEAYACQAHPVAKRGSARAVDQLEENGGQAWLPSPGKAEQFWIDWFSFLKRQGIDFVKVSPLGHPRRS